MAQTVDLGLASGSVLSVFINRIAYIEENTAVPGECFVGLVTGSVTQRVRVAASAASVAADVATASGVVVVGQPFAPLVLTVQASGDDLYIQAVTVSGVDNDLVTAGQSYVDTSGPEGRWLVTTGRVALVAALVAASAASSGTGIPSTDRLVLQAVLQGDGTILGQAPVNPPDAAIALVGPYGGEGVYDLVVSGTDLPAAYLWVPTVISGSADLTAATFAPDTVRVTSKQPSREVAVIRASAPGALQAGSFGATVTNTGAGVYEVDFEDLSGAPVDRGNYIVVPAAVQTDADALVTWERVSGLQFIVHTAAASAPAVPLNGAFSLTVLWGDGDGPAAVEPQVWALQVWALT